LRAATIKEGDTLARLETQTIDAYDLRPWRILFMIVSLIHSLINR